MEFTPWSPSRIDTFRRCKRFGYLKYNHRLDDSVGGPAASTGKLLHELAETLKEMLKIDKNADLQPEIDRYAEKLKIAGAGHMIRQYRNCASNLVKWLLKNEWVLDASTELRIGIDSDGTLVEYDKTKYLRGIIDILYDAGDGKAIVCDYKSGARVGNTSQKDVYPYMVLCMGFKEVEVRFVYLNEPEVDLPQDRKVYGRYDMAIIKAKIDSDMKIIENLPDDPTAFLPTPNEWCRYLGCRFICPFRDELDGIDKTPQELIELYHFHQTKYKDVYNILQTIVGEEGNIDTPRGVFGKFFAEQKQYALNEVVSAMLDKIALPDLEEMLRGTKMGSTEFNKIAKKFEGELVVDPKIKMISKYGYIKD